MNQNEPGTSKLLKQIKAWKRRCRKLHQRLEKLTSLHGERLLDDHVAHLMILGSYLEAAWNKCAALEIWKYGDAEYSEDEPFAALYVVTAEGERKSLVGKTLQSVLALHLGYKTRCYNCKKMKPPDAFVQRPDRRMDCCLKCHAALKQKRKRRNDLDKPPTNTAG